MTDLRKAAEMALKNWLANDEGVVKFGMKLKPEWVSTVSHGFLSGYEEALRQALAQQEEDPLVWMNKYGHVSSTQSQEYNAPLYTAPQKREWVGLTDEDLEPMCDDWRIVFGPYVHDFAKAIEAKLREKNA